MVAAVEWDKGLVLVQYKAHLPSGYSRLVEQPVVAAEAGLAAGVGAAAVGVVAVETEAAAGVGYAAVEAATLGSAGVDLAESAAAWVGLEQGRHTRMAPGQQWSEDWRGLQDTR